LAKTRYPTQEDATILGAEPDDRLIAVCICTAARPRSLETVLRAVGAANLAVVGQVTVIVVDNRPGTGAGRAVENARGSLPVPVELHVEPQAGISFARNRAVAAALAGGADLLAFLDDDDLPQPDWLDQLLRVQRMTGADIVFGGSRHPDDAPIPRRLRGLNGLKPRRLDRTRGDGLPEGISTCNVLLSCRMLERMAWEGDVFATAMESGGDIEFFQRAQRAGFATAVAPASQVVLGWDTTRYTLRGIAYRQFNYGMGHVHCAALHGAPRAELRQQAWRRLLRALLKLPLRLADPEQRAVQLMRVIGHAGEVAAGFGLRSRYYGGGARRGSSSSAK
jgi:succinoglycan biosynthesis protein ExoM